LPIIGPRIEPEKGAEIFYNWAVTPWFRPSADAQWVRPFNGVDNNCYLGLRAQFKFF
jgi:Carbohydrate-selective porin, OprB family